MSSVITLERAVTKLYDAVVIPGGGIDPETGSPRPWVRARLDAALRLESTTRYFVTLSRGTTHRSPPLNSNGFPVDEAASSAAYLLQNGVSNPGRVLAESWSLDTIGNAYFLRMMIAQPLGLRKLIIITSSFHMPRTRAIFDWVFALPEDSGPDSQDEFGDRDRSTRFSIDYCITDDVGITTEDLVSRIQKEQQSLLNLNTNTIPRIQSISALASFLFVDHGAYNARNTVEHTRVVRKEQTDITMTQDSPNDKTRNTY